ncbi:MAG: lipoprotein [Gammaproteobacteria bacterium]|nr:lipoprotein [Gammaproteobacteria bacterium]
MRKLAVVFILLGFIAGCGQKGPLYHPAPAAEQPTKDINKQEDRT